MAEETEKYTENGQPAETADMPDDLAGLKDALASLGAMVGTLSTEIEKAKDSKPDDA